VLVATTLRSAEPGTDPALLGEIRHDPATVPLRPGPLSEAAVAALVRERLGGDADPAFCAACHEATGGNPLLLRQLLRALEAEGVRPEAGQAGVVRAVGPRAVSSTVLLRLARLSAGARAVARALAVLGEGAPLPHVAGLAGQDERAVAAATGELIRAEILSPESPLGFVHPLVRDAVYHEVPPAERELEHERAAAVLREAGAGLEQVAAQLLLAPCRGAGWVVELLREAGAAARRRGAMDSAMAYLRRALEEPPAPAERVRVLIELGTAEGYTNGPAAAEHLQEAYDDLADPRARAALANGLVRALLFTGAIQRAADTAFAALEPLGPEDADLRRGLEAFARLAYYFGAGGPDVLEPLVPLRRPPEEPGPGAAALAGVAAYDWVNRGGTAQESAALSLTALGSGELIETDSNLLSIPTLVPLVLADRPEARDVMDRLEAAAHRRGSLLDISTVHLWRGYIRMWHGELEESEADLSLASRQHIVWGIGPGPRAYGDAFLTHVRLARGDLAGAREALAANTDPGGTSDGARYWKHAELALHVAEGWHEAAVEAADAFAERFAFYRDSPGSAWRHQKVAALQRLGRADEARALAEEQLAIARAFGAPGSLSAALRLLGRLEGAAGLPRLEEAVAIAAGSPARLQHAKAMLALGAALRLARSPAEARDPLRQALELAASCGAPGLAEEARAELYAAGARPRTDAMAGVAALTASEKRVAGLAATGETNRDIAQALYVTPKTVEVHLSNAYRKLGIRSRRELAGALPPRPAQRLG
jgi:DNA-binding CsgD family transcriptional regulator